MTRALDQEAFGYLPELVFPEDGTFHDWNAGRFEAIYLAFHPFVRWPSVKPFESGLVQYREYTRRGMPEGVRVRHMERMPDEPPIRYRWAEMARLTGLPDAGAVCCALRTSIGGLIKSVAREEWAKSLIHYCEQEEIFPAADSQFDFFVSGATRKLFQREGHSEAVFSVDPHPDSIIERVDMDAIGYTRFNRAVSLDKRTMAICHWDDFYTLLCGTQDHVIGVVDEFALDGFFADETTRVDWWMDAAQRAALAG